jgi:hypothetical protein
MYLNIYLVFFKSSLFKLDIFNIGLSYLCLCALKIVVIVNVRTKNL